MDTTNDGQRFTALYQRHYTDVEGYVRRRVHPSQVNDVVAEIFVVAWRRLDDLPGDGTLPWLYGVARRTLANTYRSDQRRGRLLEALAAQPDVASGDHADDVASRLAVMAAFSQLSSDHQEALRLTLWEGLSARDASRASGCSVATFQVRLHRARKRLRKVINTSIGDDSVGDVEGRNVPRTDWDGTGVQH
ncbi:MULTISPECIES: RNA polymerase sigma factor [unclassified Streptomyces]|uniref:RNA polymerase sigma factor n=1 Tax=unclassified Streptomyces TaxID=2593676 RepID=UPI0034170881